MTIHVVTTGGTIDKVYFDENSTYEVGESQVPLLLAESNVTQDFRVTQLLRKDSLHLDDDDRALVRRTVESAPETRVMITHGTDTMIQTALALRGIAGKTIVLTGALNPARFKNSDALFNVASAFMAAQCLGPGVYIVMNGRVFDPERVRKNRELNRFEPT